MRSRELRRFPTVAQRGRPTGPIRTGYVLALAALDSGARSVPATSISAVPPGCPDPRATAGYMSLLHAQTLDDSHRADRFRAVCWDAPGRRLRWQRKRDNEHHDGHQRGQFPVVCDIARAAI